MIAHQNVRPGVTPSIPALTFSIEDLFQALTLITGRDFDEAWHLVVLQLVANEAAADTDAAAIMTTPVTAPIIAAPTAATIAAPAAAAVVAAPAAAPPIIPAAALIVAAPVAAAVIAAPAAAPIVAPPVAAAVAAAPVINAPVAAPITAPLIVTPVIAAPAAPVAVILNAAPVAAPAVAAGPTAPAATGGGNAPLPNNTQDVLRAAIQAALAQANQPVPVLPGRWYVVTRGRGAIGVFQGWHSISPLVSGMPTAVCEHVASWDVSFQQFREAVAADNVQLLP
ncbi:hypothetical protein SCP_1301540 [Sparassis crispa]|uniref:Uncharacterized protein n=1 Tax=Sparassis crispa TaxID=139825 RepID=A0A401H1S0_9APHY|nr:hypothetical protein SCP_1301540 [Sparassis crispa]GBE88339.1 hypothetical protein SCP_1301540 [Sparassis crispa]